VAFVELVAIVEFVALERRAKELARVLNLLEVLAALVANVDRFNARATREAMALAWRQPVYPIVVLQERASVSI
jgi:hypothetical protein